jgi:hypothetical protein
LAGALAESVTRSHYAAMLPDAQLTDAIERIRDTKPELWPAIGRLDDIDRGAD